MPAIRPCDTYLSDVRDLRSHPRGLDRSGAKVFRFTKCGRLYQLLAKVKEGAGPDVAFATFHTFRHTYGTWMSRYAGLDTHGLVKTGTWDDPASAERYRHTVASEEAQRAALLPVEKAWKARTKIDIVSKIKAL